MDRSIRICFGSFRTPTLTPRVTAPLGMSGTSDTPSPASTIFTTIPVVVASMSIRGLSPRLVEGVQHVLPAGRTALEDDQRHIDEVGQREVALAEQRVAGRSDQSPVEREEVPVFQPGTALVRRGHAEREVRVAQSASSMSRSVRELSRTRIVGEGPVEPADRVDHRVEGEVLRGRDVDLVRPFGVAEQPAEPAGVIEERDRVRQELFALRRQRRPPPRAALLVVQRHLQLRFQRDEPVPHALLGDVQLGGRGPQTPGAGQFDQGRDLIGRDGRERSATVRLPGNTSRSMFTIHY